MQKRYSNFPGSMHGIGLFILRTTAGAGTAFYGIMLLSRAEQLTTSQFLSFSHLISGLLLVSGSLLLVLGLLMPFVLIIVGASGAIAAYIIINADQTLGEKIGWTAMLMLAGIIITLFFTGPGAFSIDARLYGRREIFLPSSKKEERKES